MYLVKEMIAIKADSFSLLNGSVSFDAGHGVEIFETAAVVSSTANLLRIRAPVPHRVRPQNHLTTPVMTVFRKVSKVQVRDAKTKDAMKYGRQ